MRGLSKSKRLNITLAASLFVILSVPMVLYALLSSESVDTRSGAEDRVVSYCNINFPFVNPKTIEAGKIVQVDINGFAPSDTELITDVLIKTTENIILLDKTYDEPQQSISERVTFTRTDVGDVQILGQMGTTGNNQPCIMEGITTNLVRTQQANDAPQFTSNPATDAQPSNSLLINDDYLYELTSSDADGDDIEFSYSFTPRADWLNMSVVSDGQGGTLKLKMEGKADKAASYLVNVFTHDGYNAHLRSQSWVISVSPNENDTPQVTITKPAPDATFKQGENINISWSATDQNQIVKYKLYYATNPGDQNTWVAIDENLSYKVGSYILVTNQIEPGDYKFIVQAEDNQSPAAVGTGISGSLALATPDGETITPNPQPDPQPDPNPDQKPEPEPEPEPDDGPVLTVPQIIGLNPAPDSTISNLRRTISATLIAGDKADVNLEEIAVMLDEKEITDEIEISQITPDEATILFKPTQDFEEGEHKVYVYFRDSAGNEKDAEWNFTIEVIQDDTSALLDLLGFEITNRTILIIVVGLGIILLALIVPWLLYIAWRDSGDSDNNTVYNIPPSNGGGSNQREKYNATTTGGDSKYFIPPTKNAPIKTAPPVSKPSTKSEAPPSSNPPIQNTTPPSNPPAQKSSNPPVSNPPVQNKANSSKSSTQKTTPPPPPSNPPAQKTTPPPPPSNPPAQKTAAPTATNPPAQKSTPPTTPPAEKVYSPDSDELTDALNTIALGSTGVAAGTASKEEVGKEEEKMKTETKNTSKAKEESELKNLQASLENQKKPEPVEEPKTKENPKTDFATEQMWQPRVIKPPKNEVESSTLPPKEKPEVKLEDNPQVPKGDQNNPSIASNVKFSDGLPSDENTPPTL